MTTYTYDELAQIRRELLRQIDSMKNCYNCKYESSESEDRCSDCDCSKYSNWEWDGEE